ncbi:hypothetical protein DOK76_12910 [Vagococcus sp. DIV0080]|uniref:Uncharacterized protein n=1 Tax=Candidatus Vagococcus giribetii TaxID=2230876 RepID=A0ABS3HYR0_9ENTE|nr:hypothetical protein [Vagococcus sp. DIV0080]MBO0477966.1 hypothetical protein [Vagococcus sp. DIV0080]
MIELNDYYHDRGIVKYNVFFLSEHTSGIEKTSSERNRVIADREKMSEELIFEIIDFSIYKNKKISIQLDIKDIEGNFLDDYVGFVSGYDEGFIYLDDVAVPITQIRNVLELETKSWYRKKS